MEAILTMRFSNIRLLALALLASAMLLVWPAAARSGTITVATAATMRYAFEDIIHIFQRKTGHIVRPVYGSSGNFVSQVRQGAPFDLFVAADLKYPQVLLEEGLAMAPVQEYARGRLVLLLPKGSPLKADGSLADLRAAFADGRLKKLAIANPRLAPYGERAREALQHAGLWQAIEPNLVVGENVSQATQFVSTGAAQAGLVALSLAMAPQLRDHTHYAVVPSHFHQPLAQGVVVLKGSNPAAAQLQRFLMSPQARAILKRYGYEIPHAAGPAPK
ncbi:molybdate ABC transporter substrate-binding protein [Limnobacter sp.]|uniref:molybdate ABC transporter substrate-binding protein n=2 Tax=Limnobacter sp. TaxID=2003368 RepID=UPI003559A580